MPGLTLPLLCRVILQSPTSSGPQFPHLKGMGLDPFALTAPVTTADVQWSPHDVFAGGKLKSELCSLPLPQGWLSAGLALGGAGTTEKKL